MASGYLFGEILSKLSLQPDFPSFQSDGSPDAMINNFTRLHPTLKQLGVKFDSNVANALMREEKGTAAQLLYSIKRAVSEHRSPLDAVKKGSKLGKTLGIKSTLNRGMLEAQNHRTKLERHQLAELAQTEELLRQRAANPKATLQSLHLQPFADVRYHAHCA